MEADENESVLSMLKAISRKLSIQQYTNTEKDLAWSIFRYFQVFYLSFNEWCQN
jgi:hypothetical protein